MGLVMEKFEIESEGVAEVRLNLAGRNVRACNLNFQPHTRHQPQLSSEVHILLSTGAVYSAIHHSILVL